MRYYGFNFQWMFSLGNGPAEPADEKALDFLAKRGFNYVRIPTDYRFWTNNFDYLNPDPTVIDIIDDYLSACNSRGLHMCLNLHRAPGYCINKCELERDNLWTDAIAQEAFIFLWTMFAERYREVHAEALSFDLVNEPPSVGMYGMTRENHERLVRQTVKAIREVDPHRPVTIDGLEGGNKALPELADLDVTHSGRGYQPAAISHYKASFAESWLGTDLPDPVWPGLIWNGQTWDKDALRKFYKPWREVEGMGRTVHIGEFGCYSKAPNEVALAWLGDCLDLWREYRWGYAMWRFNKRFGLVDHGRDGARIERVDGYDVDRDLLQLLEDARVM